ncbi:MAG: hypothetical protein RL093_1878 [Pseudomonadota bacterium]
MPGKRAGNGKILAGIITQLLPVQTRREMSCLQSILAGEFDARLDI